MALGEIDVRPERFDRALAARNGKRQKSLGPAKLDLGSIDDRPPVRADHDSPPAGVAQIEEKCGIGVVAISPGAKEDRRDASIVQSHDLARIDDTPNHRLGGGFELFAPAAFDQPVAERRRVEAINRVEAVDEDPGIEPIVWRAKHSRIQGADHEEREQKSALRV